MKILNLYAGIGGNRKLWGDEHEITAVEYDPAIAEVYAEYFPNDRLVIGDAHQYLLDHIDYYDFIWSSPPCPTHSILQRTNHGRKPQYPSMTLYQEIIFLSHFCKAQYCVENVIPYYDPLIKPSFKMHRHLYWNNFKIPFTFNGFDTERKHMSIEGNSIVYGFDLKGTNIKDKRKSLRNMVDPKLGLHILNAAQGIHTKRNEHQLDLEL